MNQYRALSPHSYPKKNILDSVRIESKAAWILFHHQAPKKSVVSKMIYTRQGIDSLFKYTGIPNVDTNCLKGGLHHHFGEITLYKDSSGTEGTGELHFVLDGICEGFYLQTANYLKRYDITSERKVFLSELYNTNRNMLK